MKSGEEIVENLEQIIRCLMEFEYIWMLIVVSGKCEAKHSVGPLLYYLQDLECNEEDEIVGRCFTKDSKELTCHIHLSWVIW